jgi:hypothetical protein
MTSTSASVIDKADFPVDDGADADAVSKRFLERVAKNLGPDLGG